MPAYQPPHLRDRPKPSSGQNLRGGRSASRPTASGSSLVSPASDIRPSTRSDLHMRPNRAGVRAGSGIGEDMEFIQSVSRSGGDGAEGDALKDWGLQERYRKYIDERLDKHYRLFPGPRDTPPPTGATDQTESLGSIVLLFRKLREGVVASGRIDSFAIEVFESSATTAILAHNTAQLLSSLSGFIPGLYNAVGNLDSAPIPPSDSLDGLTGKLSSLQLESSRSIKNLDQTDNRGLFASLLLLFHLCQSDSSAVYHNTLISLTRPASNIFRAPFSDLTNTPATSRVPPRPFLHPLSKSLRLARRLRHILSVESFDPISFWSLLNDRNISPYERTMMSWASERVRERAWEVMRKSYLEISTCWAGEWLGLSSGPGPGGLEDWVGKKGVKVEGSKIKLR